ncbi:uncharacterized protein [Palaemon carinicauda]|uniref:uncharacterized protein n=1 Tax=Palaemon carinicauda TaxID=392227 RepID=UPI0035B6AA31
MCNLPFHGDKEGTQAEDEVDLAKAADFLKVCMDEMSRLGNQFEDVKKEATDIAQKWSIRPEFEKKRLYQLYEKASSFVNKYHNDVSVIFTQEILSMRSALKGEISKVSSIKNLDNMLIIENHSTSASFPEVCTAMLLFLTIPVTTASAERSFSKLKLVKNYLRSTMAMERLEGLALLSIEQGTARKLNLGKVIDRFAEMKARKKEF